MADEYIDAPVEFDENALYNTGIARIQEYFPNWSPKANGFIDLVLRGVASMAAVDAEVASTVPFSIFRAFGPLAHNLPIDATAAIAQTVWTVIDDQGGYQIPSGTPVGLTLSTVQIEPVGFETVGDVVVPAGQQTIAITVVATIPGGNGSSLDTIIRADSLAFVTSVTLNGPSQGGSDAELDDAFVDRLSSDFELWTTTPIRGPDFAKKARDIAGVYRCAYWENYNPADQTTDNDKFVTLCPIDINGADVSSATQQAVQTYIESLREVNFVCPVVDSSRSVIAVNARLHVSDPNMQADAIALAGTTLQSFFSPSTWGVPTTGTGQYPVWNNEPVVRISRVTTVLEDVTNVNYADQVQIGFQGQAMGSVDLTMPGAFPLPSAGTLNITAVTP
jgi:hypothetical protein